MNLRQTIAQGTADMDQRRTWARELVEELVERKSFFAFREEFTRRFYTAKSAGDHFGIVAYALVIDMVDDLSLEMMKEIAEAGQ